MIDPTLMQAYIRDANPIPDVQHLDPDELAYFVAALHAKHKALEPGWIQRSTSTERSVARERRGGTDMTNITEQKPAPTTLGPAPTKPAVRLRRNRLVFGLAMALLVMAVGAVSWWVGSSGSDSTEVPPEIESILDRFDEAWRAGDAAALASLYAENATYEEPSLDNIATGRSFIESRAALAMRFTDYAEFERHTMIAREGVVVTEATVSGMSSVVGRDPDDRTPFETTVVWVHEIEDGLITNSILYYDASEMFN